MVRPSTVTNWRVNQNQCGIEHHRITILWPQANGEVESFMTPLGKAIRAARTERRDWHNELHRFLLSYRTTPHTTTDVRIIRSTTPSYQSSESVDSCAVHRKSQWQRQEKKREDEALCWQQVSRKNVWDKAGRHSSGQTTKEKQVHHDFRPQPPYSGASERIHDFSSRSKNSDHEKCFTFQEVRRWKNVQRVSECWEVWRWTEWLWCSASSCSCRTTGWSPKKISCPSAENCPRYLNEETY